MENQEASGNYWTITSFIIRGESVDPEVITAQLSVAPSRSLRKGEKPRESDRYKPSPFGLWSIEAETDNNATLIQQLQELLDVLEPKKLDIVQIAKQTNVWFQCAAFNGDGLDIPNAILLRIASLRADLTVNVYPADHDIWEAYKAAGGK
ncbi:DUF4279 domain-containing protein [Phototrophicus methaneseepsis]|uniref:DUF4279 domain-containing protein n=1 Tax=Phototrophicus methaneseepsis TaxID=2710758 RepID=A0A7S8IG53_9CHLR|nr:DUF4279 domain-containing protein [Phototrophicus methaneseepsis]QPC83623.1 DUF4279 domain-containing protein [Phototrophicus methaneseepsis]